jgi:hypothetical protein
LGAEAWADEMREERESREKREKRGRYERRERERAIIVISCDKL